MVFIHKLMCHDSSEMLEGKGSEMLEGGRKHIGMAAWGA
jgi:hypothetical protein